MPRLWDAHDDGEHLLVRQGGGGGVTIVTGNEPSDRKFVPPESVSWCISDTSKKAWDGEGIVLTKAHRIKVKTDLRGNKAHVPLCGAQVAHYEIYCVQAPQGWPQCKACTKSLKVK